MPSLELENSIVDDRYEVRRRLDHGSYAEIYEAFDLTHGRRRVIIKALNTALQGTPEEDLERTLVENFQNEAIALDSVSHANVVRRLGHGTAADLAGTPFHYLVLEYMGGGNLMALCRRGRLTLEQTLYYARQICDALEAAHARGIIHRDIKPHNLMLTEADGAPRWKIVDLGIAQLDGVGRRAMGGTPAYMAPEQALGERIDQRADLYGLSAVVYRALTGRPAFSGGDRIEVAHAARERGPEDPTGFVSMSRALELCLRIGLAPTASDRFATARELATAFEDAFEGAIKDRHRARGEAVLARLPWAPPTENVAEPPQA